MEALVTVVGMFLLWRRGRLLDDADEGDLGAAVDVELVAAEDERHGAHHVQMYAPRQDARARRDLRRDWIELDQRGSCPAVYCSYLFCVYENAVRYT